MLRNQSLILYSHELNDGEMEAWEKHLRKLREVSPLELVFEYVDSHLGVRCRFGHVIGSDGAIGKEGRDVWRPAPIEHWGRISVVLDHAAERAEFVRFVQIEQVPGPRAQMPAQLRDVF